MGLRTALYITQIDQAIDSRVPCIHLEHVTAARSTFKGQEDKGSPQEHLRAKLERAGYKVWDEDLNAAFIGGMADRERLHTVAIPNELHKHLTKKQEKPFGFKFPIRQRPTLKENNVINNVEWPPTDPSLVTEDSELSEFYFVKCVNTQNPTDAEDVISGGDQCRPTVMGPRTLGDVSSRRIRGKPLPPGSIGSRVNRQESVRF